MAFVVEIGVGEAGAFEEFRLGAGGFHAGLEDAGDLLTGVEISGFAEGGDLVQTQRVVLDGQRGMDAADAVFAPAWLDAACRGRRGYP